MQQGPKIVFYEDQETISKLHLENPKLFDKVKLKQTKSKDPYYLIKNREV